MRGALPAIVEVVKADDKNDHDAANIICDARISVLVFLPRLASPLNRPARRPVTEPT